MNRIVNLLPVIGVVLLFLACSKTSYRYDSSNKELFGSYEIELEDALTSLESLMRGLETKSSFQKSFSKDSVFIVKHGDRMTKGENSTGNGALLYAVNFDGNEGYAVMAADRRIGTDVLCVTERGTISSELFSLARSKMNSAVNSTGELTRKCMENDDSLFVPMILLSGADGLMANADDPGPGPEVGGGGVVGVIGPLLMTKWKQRSFPYDSLTPNHYPAGCVVTAVAQIMAFEESPSSLVCYGDTCSWSSMKTVNTYPNVSYGGTAAGRSQVANFMAYLGNSSNCAVSYGETGSSATAWDARRAFINNGFSDVTIHYGLTGFTNSMHSSVRSQLFDGHPVYCDGSKGLNDGHAWVIDGYYAGLYHINWGWSGKSDGYFNAGVFNTSQRVSISSIDSGEEHSSPSNYHFDFSVITYERE